MSKQLIFTLMILVSLVFAAGCFDPPAPTASQTDQSTWASYVDKPDGCKISHPADWTVIISKTEPTKTGVSYLTMENNIHIYTPEKDGLVQIMGFAYPEELRKDVGISDAAYDVMVKGFAKGSPPEVRALNVMRDDNSYKINGNSARHVQLDLTVGGVPMTSDVYIIRYKDVWYSVSYLTIEPTALKHSATATEIMKTFKTVAWES
jgi:hypothetical protein